ncbi:hypothetical protein V6N11_043604 [Hibiscus sabdariffa]|uniref:Pyrrolo-quinoline quinone repeat domain-containing protein n=1 Tax=Hibiscus sabdariffa TaxID=183260 RepID=A0ABR2RCR3_9ROSI
MYGFEAMTFNIHGGYLEAIVRGHRAGLLTAADYNNLCQCETLDDIKMHLSATEYGPYLQNEPSPLHTTTIVEKCTLKLVDEYKHMLCQATEPLSTFLEYITYGHMIDNVVLIVTGTLHERDVQELLEKCHPLGMFDSIATLAVAQNMRELYRLVLVDTPLAPYFSECITSEDLDDMNIEIMRNTLYKAYLEDFYKFCQKLGGATAEIMSDLLSFEADRRAVNITINSIGTELTRDDRRKLYSNFGLLYPYGHEELAVCEDIDQVRSAMEKYPPYQSIFSKLSYGESQMLDKAFYEEEVKRLCLAFEQQFHYGVFFAYMRLREQEIRNLMWISECVAQNQKSRDWLSHGGNILNRRFADRENKISPETVSKLRLKWKFDAGRDISATPSVSDGAVYFPCWDGYLYAVKESDGSLIWKQNLQHLTGFNSTGVISNVKVTASRTTPAVADDLLIIGISGPASIVAVKRSNGDFVWSTLLDDNPYGCITMSGTYYKGNFYVGTSSLEETLSIEECCIFRGSFVKLNATTGKILWQTLVLPDNFGNRGQYSGAAIWGSSPSIDVTRNLVYIATGNLYSAPQNITECQERQNNQTQVPPTHTDECIEPDNHSDSFLALDLDTGNIKWFHQFGGYDVFFIACNNLSVPDCPPGPNPDADFGEAPMMLSINVNGTKKDIVVAVQKSGFAWALDRDDGNIIWSTEAGPGGIAGGGTWGAATDEMRVYTNIANSDGKNFTLKPSSRNTTAGGWVTMDAKTGQILWSTGDPSNGTASGPVTVANGVLFGGSTYKEGPIYAMDAKSGEILWSYNTGASVFGGMSVSDGCIFIGHGYKVSFGASNPNFSAGNSLFAFCIF